MKNLLVLSSFLFFLLGLSGCGGTKMLKEPEPLVVTQSLGTASDQHFSATLDWVIFRDGPGTWAKNVDWDEYMIGVENLSDDSLQLTNITVVDSLGTQIEPRQDRKQLVKGTKETKRRYKGEGLKVKAGVSGREAILFSKISQTSAIGRFLPVRVQKIRCFERPLSGKADVQNRLLKKSSLNGQFAPRGSRTSVTITAIEYGCY